MLQLGEKQPNLPYYPVSQFYKQKFGEKVFKIPVAIAGDCPNRAGIKGMQTCIFCDEWGSFAYPKSLEKTLGQQIEAHREKVAKRYNSKKFFIYFQAYTTTFKQLSVLREAFQLAMSYDDVVGIIIGTRPDCLSHALFDTFNEISQKTFLGIELGIQSFADQQLTWMRRGHTRQQAIQGVLRLQKNCPNIDLGIHLMFGWPGETSEDIIAAAKTCNELGINNVKLHNLHVLKNTPLEKLYQQGEFRPIELDDYCRLVGIFLQHLSPTIALHRLVALAANWDELIAPQWTRFKMTNFQHVIDYLLAHQITQGQLYHGSAG